MKENVFDTRRISSFPVSIGTGLMLESLFKTSVERADDTRKIPNEINPNNYAYYIMHVGTLIRNILSSVDYKDKLELVGSKNFVNCVIDEINVIASLFSTTKCKFYIFMPDYEYVLKHMNKNKFDVITPPAPYLHYKDGTNIFVKNKVSFDVPMVSTNYRLPKLEGKGLITTSAPVDLLNTNCNLTLLESHTGVIKEKWQWSNKLHKIGDRALTVFPFIEEIVYILGDNFIVQDSKLPLRVKLHELAVNKSWTARTTRDKVKFDISNSIPELSEILKSYTKIY